MRKTELREGDRVICRHPSAVSNIFFDQTGVITSTPEYLPAYDDFSFNVNFDGILQTAYEDRDGIVLVKDQDGYGDYTPVTVTTTTVTPTQPEGRKDDSGKYQMELLPPELMVEVSKVLTFGAKKYEPRNWEKGMDWGRVYGAMQRHLNAWWSGEDKDPETGLSHMAHAACNAAFLLAYEQRGVGNDSRFKTSS